MKKTNIADYFLPAASIKKLSGRESKSTKGTSITPTIVEEPKERTEEMGGLEECGSDSGASTSSNRGANKLRCVNEKIIDLDVGNSEEKSFPIPYHKFLEYTNVLDVAHDEIKMARPHSYKEFINNIAYVQKVARRCYQHFYMNPKSRRKSPLKNLTVSEDCPKQLKMHLMEIPDKYQTKKSKTKDISTKESAKDVEMELVNPELSTSISCNSKPADDSSDCINLDTLTSSSNCPPPSFKIFKKFVNFEDTITQQMLDCTEDKSNINKSILREKLELEFYKKFYALPKLRQRLKWKMRPCPRKIREQILTHLPLEDTIILHEGSNEPDIILASEKDKNELTNDKPHQKEVHHFQYPISFDLFKKYTYQNQIVDEIFKATSEDNDQVFEELKSNEALREETFQNYYKAFYRTPQIREKFKIKLKPCPSKIKQLVLQMPKEANGTKTLKIAGNLRPSYKRCSSPSDLILPQTKKQKTTETNELTKNKSPNSNTNQQPSSSNETQTNVQVKTVSACSFGLFKDYFSKKTFNMEKEKLLTIHKKIKEPNANNAIKPVVDPLSPESTLKKMVSPKANTNSMSESKKHDLPLKTNKRKKKMSQKTLERFLENSLSSEDNISSYCRASLHDSDETDVNSELERTTVRNVVVPAKENKTTPKVLNSSKFKQNCDDIINENDNNAKKEATKATKNHAQESDIVSEKVMKERNETEAMRRAVSPKDSCAYLTNAHDSDETDVNSELEMISFSNPIGRVNINKFKTEALVRQRKEQLQKRSGTPKAIITQDSLIVTENSIRTRNEMDGMNKSLRHSDIKVCEKQSESSVDITNIGTRKQSFLQPAQDKVEILSLKSVLRSKDNNNNAQEEHTSLDKTQPAVVVKSKPTKESMLQDYTNDIFFRKVDKSHSLAYAVRRSGGLKRRILLAVFRMSIEEFTKYTRIHERPKFYKDPEVLKKMYEFVFINEQTWPPILYMTLSDTLVFLKSKGIVLKDLDLQHISPKFLHFEELAIITNFDEIVQLDYFKETAKKLENLQIKERRYSFYKRCWAHDKWIWRVPTVYENWKHMGQHKDADITAKLITSPRDKICRDAKQIEMTQALDMETNSTSTNGAADDIEQRDTATKYLVASSWGKALLELEQRARGLKKTEDDVETVIFRIPHKESTSASQKSYNTNDDSVKDMPDIQAKEIENSEDFNTIETCVENKAASTSVQTTISVYQKSVIVNSVGVSGSQNVKSIPELTQTPGTSHETNEVPNNIDKQLPTNKTLLPLSPNIFISSSGSTTSQHRSQHHLSQSCTSTLIFSNKSLTISSCTNTSTEMNEFYINMPNTQNQIESLPIDEMLCNDPLKDETQLKDSLATNIDNALGHNVLSSKELDANAAQSDNQPNKKADTLMRTAEVTSKEQQNDKIIPVKVYAAPEEKPNAVSHENTTGSMPTENLESILNTSDVSNKECQASKNHSSDVDKEAKIPANEILQVNQAKVCTPCIKESRIASSSETNEETRQAASFQSISQPNKSVITFTRTSQHELTKILQSESDVMDESGAVPLSVKQEIVDRNSRLQLSNIVQSEDCNSTTIVIDDSDDEAALNQSTSNVAIKEEPKFLNHLQFSLDDSNNSVDVHALQESPAIIIDDDDCAVNDANLIDQLMNPTEQITFPSFSRSGISSSLLNDAACTFSEAQRLPSSLEAYGSIHQTPQSETDSEIRNSNDIQSNSSEDVELFLEINVEKVDDFADADEHIDDEQHQTEPEVALNPEEDQLSNMEIIPSTLIASHTTNLPTESNKNSTNIGEKKQKTGAATKSNRQTENKNSHLVPQITHAFRSLPVTVVKAKSNANPTIDDINTASSSSKNCSSTATISNTQPVINNSGTNSTKTLDSGSTTKSFSASQALAIDCTFFENSQLLRDLEKVQSHNIKTSTTAVCAELKATSSISSVTLAASSTSSSQQVNEQYKHLNKPIIYRNLYQFHYFSALNEKHIADYELPLMAFKQQYMQAHVRVPSGHRLKIHDCDFLPLLFPTFSHKNLCDLFNVLTDIKEYHFKKSDTQTINTVDLRERVLFYLFSSAPIFCYCNLKFDCSLREYATCAPITSIHSKSPTRQPRHPLTASIKPSILKNISRLKSQLASKK